MSTMSKPETHGARINDLEAAVGGMQDRMEEMRNWITQISQQLTDLGKLTHDTSVNTDTVTSNMYLRENAIWLEEKERREKELLSNILVEADEFKVAFHRKIQVKCEANIATNRKKEKVFVAGQDKFYAEADKDYWKSIAELIPKEVPAIEKRKGKKEQEKKPSAVVLRGPKPGKPTDLTRMKQLFVKLKHNTPSHLKASPRPAPDANTDASVSLKAPAEAVAVA